MVSFVGFLFIYFIGGITFLPLIALAAFIYIKGGIQPFIPEPKKDPEAVAYKDLDNVVVKKGWIRLTNQYQPKMPETHNIPDSKDSGSPNNNSGIISGIQNYVSKEGNGNKKGVVYAVLKHGTLFCYESENSEQVVMIIPMQNYHVSLYPPNKPDKPEGAIFGRTAVTRLVPNSLYPLHDDDKEPPSICTLSEEDITCMPNRTLYLTCARGTDKEDWYFGLLEARHLLIEDEEESAHYVMMDNTHFNPSAMEELIRQVQSSPSHRETAWINAVFGRLFLGMYKTDRLKNFVEMKIRKKIDKTKRPTFLDEITVRKVDVGESVPFITDPKLLSLSPEGEVIVEAKVEYKGGLAIEIETDFNWSYHSRMKPIRMNLILSVKLKSMSGRMMFKLKAPPTNRYWLAFFEMPEMEWKITPVVADKQIKLAIVTNAIESRIREVMAETFVLPNMDDTSFCPSGGKGGIFGEYIKVKKTTPKESTYHKEENTSNQHTRKDSAQSEHSRYRETPTVPDHVVKTPAADVLKLKNRRAESVVDFAGKDSDSTKTLLENQQMEMSQSTPDLLFTQKPKEHHHSDDNESIKSDDQHSIAESTASSSTGTKWSNASNYIRKRMVKSNASADHHSDAESTKTHNSTSGSGFLSKVAKLLPSDSLPSEKAVEKTHTTTPYPDTQSISSSSTNSSNKRSSLVSMAENFLTKKPAQQNNPPMSEEKRGVYAERMANMRKRAEEKLSAVSSSIANSKLSPPALPRSSRNSVISQHSLLDDDSESPDLQAPIIPSSGVSTTVLDDAVPLSDAPKALPVEMEAKTDDQERPVSVSSLPTMDTQSHDDATTPSDTLMNTSQIQTPKEIVTEKETPPIVNEEQDTKAIQEENLTRLLPALPTQERPPIPTSPRPKLPTVESENKPELPQVPRPVLPAYTPDMKPELPAREGHGTSRLPPPVPPRHT